jgi:hypothetical protein
MTTSTSTARKTTPAKKAAPAKATKAPTKATKAAAMVKAAPTPAARKLRWQVEGDDRGMAGKVNQTATVDGHTYAIERSGDAWKATHTLGKKKTVLVEGTFAAAYQSCVAHNRAR